MTSLNVLAFFLYTFGAVTFGSLGLLWLRSPDPRRPGEKAYAFMTFYAVLWFVCCLLRTVWEIFAAQELHWIGIVNWQMAFFWPPLIVHTQYAEAVDLLARARATKWVVGLVYGLAVPLSAMPGLIVIGFFSRDNLLWVSLAFAGLFVVAITYCAAMAHMTRPVAETPDEKKTRHWTSMLYVLVVVVIIGQMTLENGVGVLTVVASSFPLMFVFVSTYYLERFLFFDVFIKRGSFACIALLLLLGVTGVLYRLGGTELGATQPWLYTLALLPLALAFPWIYRTLERVLDRSWLGRRFTPLEAVKHFLSQVQNATGEAELIACAEEGLAAIFQAPTRICIDCSPGLEFKSALEMPIRMDGDSVGRVSMGARTTQMPYFSKDFALLRSLTEVFARLLENIRLQERKQNQEKRERELTLHASRSELKALRAQINPHFLFNALNAIAGLIPRHPERAEETVEQLAEIFRYTLTGSEREWVTLREEMDFVQTYLDIEKARFGRRLDVTVSCDEGISDVKIPAMMLQTLVENAVKHGVSRVKSNARILVRATTRGEFLRVDVSDNGPGPVDSPASRVATTSGTGYGLRNIRERLAGYYSARASLDLTRDAATGTTIASIEVPMTPTIDSRRTG